MLPRWLKESDIVAASARLYYRMRARRLEKVIFTATTGRSGTKTLAALFSTISDCVAFHEPYPVMNGPVLRAASYGDLALVDRIYRRVKSINILRSAIGFRYYVEANHLFVKTFIGQAVEEFGDRIAVIHLVRSPIEVAMSMYCLEHLPGTEIGDYWWLEYRAPSNVIRIADLLETDEEFAHPFYRGLWYWYELEMRFLAWRNRLPSLKVVRFHTSWFNDTRKTFQLLDELGMVYDKGRIASAVGQREHTKADRKVLAPLPAQQAEAMHDRFRQLLVERGVDIPRVTYHE